MRLFNSIQFNSISDSNPCAFIQSNSIQFSQFSSFALVPLKRLSWGVVERSGWRGVWRLVFSFRLHHANSTRAAAVYHTVSAHLVPFVVAHVAPTIPFRPVLRPTFCCIVWRAAAERDLLQRGDHGLREGWRVAQGPAPAPQDDQLGGGAGHHCLQRVHQREVRGVAWHDKAWRFVPLAVAAFLLCFPVT